MKIVNLKTNRMVTPIGFAFGTPAFSWTVEDTEAKCQVAARVQVSANADLTAPIFDTGRDETLCSLEVPCTATLAPCTRYYWAVTVWADNGEEATAASWFETGKMGSAWQAQWIGGAKPHALLAKDFTVTGDVVSARLYATACGIYEAELGGVKVGDEFLAPGYNNYNHFIQIQTYDVTGQLHPGANRLGFWLGKGWYAGRFTGGKTQDGSGLFGNETGLLAQLVITYADGSTAVIGTDTTWLTCDGPVTQSSIYDGEWYDARLEVPGWSDAATPLTGWQAARTVAAPAAPLVDRWSLPTKIMHRWPTEKAELIHTPAGETVIDFHQEMTGWVEFDCDLPEGTVVTLEAGEILQQGNFYNENLRSALARYTYISAGRPATVRPRFTFFGFRYMRVTGIEKLDLADFRACVIYSDMPATGSITTSNEKVNRLIENVHWGQRGNFVDVPTDCPQRDERLGWTGDAEIFCSTANFNMDTAQFYTKYLQDMLHEQYELDGAVPHVVPDVLTILVHSVGDYVNLQYGSCAWSDAATIIPWNNWLYFGRRTQLEREYENMKLWTDWIHKQDEEKCGGKRLWHCGFQYGDWLALDNPDKDSPFGGTDVYYVASGYYYWSARLTARAAAALGKADEAAYYNNLADEVRAAIRAEYFTSTGRLAVPTQTAHAMALYMDLAPESAKARIAADLAAKLDARNGYLDTGFVGTYQLCAALSENGLVDKMYTLLLNEGFPSWLYEVNMGATTIWERWNSVQPDGSMNPDGMNSLNHYAYGAVMEWMYRYMCGLNPVAEAPGFKKAVIRPMADARFDHAAAWYDSAAGRYESAWRKEGEGFVYTVTVPFDAQATFVLPGAANATVNGQPCKELAETGRVTLAAGSYVIRP